MKFRITYLFLLMVLLTGCFRKFSMTEHAIRQHYIGKATRPTFYTIEDDSTKLFVATLGADTLPPLLLIHGAPGNWYGYLRTMDDTLLQRRFQMLVVERPGYGKSRQRRPLLRLKSRMGIDFQARSIAKALSLNRSGQLAIVLGRSYGAPIAVRLATLSPEKVGHLFLISPAIDPDKEKFWWFSKWGRLPLVQLFLPRSLNLATYEKYEHAHQLRGLLPYWSQLRPPITVVQGAQDWLIDQGNLAFAKRMLANKPARFQLLPDAGHLITDSHVGVVRALILNAADSLYQRRLPNAPGHVGGHE